MTSSIKPELDKDNIIATPPDEDRDTGCGSFADTRFDDKPFDRQTFRRHGSDVSPTHSGRFDDNPWNVSSTSMPELCERLNA